MLTQVRAIHLIEPHQFHTRAGKSNIQPIPTSHKGRVERESLEKERGKEVQRVKAEGDPMLETHGPGGKPVKEPELPSTV
jgi:hypothetical protein